MRKSHEKVCRAFLAREPACAGNVSTDGKELRLFGNVIAKHGYTEDAAGGKHPYVCASPGRWTTRTTMTVLNALSFCAGSSVAWRVRGGIAQVWHPHQERWLNAWPESMGGDFWIIREGE